MEFLATWRKPAPLEYRRLDVRDGTVDALDERWEFVRPLPPVIIVTDRAMFQWRRDVPSLEDLGYLQVEWLYWLGASRHVRGRWLWCLHRGGCWLWARTRWLAWVGRKEHEAPRW